MNTKMNVISALILLTALCESSLTQTTRADSLWKDGSSASLFTDQKAHAVGDLVTIIVTETSSTSQQASTTVSKKSDLNIAKGIGPLLSILPHFGLGGSSSTQGQGSTSRTANMNARITAKVVEVKPNGTMVLEGVRDLTSNNDTQKMKLTGVVRVKDVAADNTVQSSYIADAKIDIIGKGPISDKQKPGIISRLLKAIF